MFAQGRKVATVLFDRRGDLAAKIHEVMLDEADDMEAVCNDACLRKVLFNQRSVAGAHIHAHDPDFVAALQGFEEGLKILSAFALGNIEDTVSFKIAEGGGKSTSFVEGMLIDTKDFGAFSGKPLSGFALCELLVNSLYRGAADLSDGGKPLAADAVVMIAVNALAERLGRMSSWQNTGKRLHETLVAVEATEAPAFHDER